MISYQQRMISTSPAPFKKIKCTESSIPPSGWLPLLNYTQSYTSRNASQEKQQHPSIDLLIDANHKIKQIILPRLRMSQRNHKVRRHQRGSVRRREDRGWTLQLRGRRRFWIASVPGGMDVSQRRAFGYLGMKFQGIENWEIFRRRSRHEVAIHGNLINHLRKRWCPESWSSRGERSRYKWESVYFLKPRRHDHVGIQRPSSRYKLL